MSAAGTASGPSGDSFGRQDRPSERPSPSAGPARTPAPSNRAAFLFGVPAGLLVLLVLHLGPHDSALFRYVSHPIECVEVVLFCCALAALIAKAHGHRLERHALRHDVLPTWRGQALAAAEAGPLRAGLSRLGRALQETFLVRRVRAILDFVASRGSAAQLDDQIRTLSDNDALAVEGSYSLVRFITWAIPILGFLGTVLGITEAIAGVTPEILEKSLSQVTDGLALAFDTTALALGLTMILMFVSFLVERLEQGTLALVDRYVDAQLAHRFERLGGGRGEYVQALEEHTQVLLRATEQLVQRQASVWAKTLEKADRFWVDAAQKLTDRLSQALDSLAQVLREATREHRTALNEVAERLSTQAATLAQLQAGEAQLVRLQDTLQQNLTSLAGAGAFEQAVESLTAAIHLLTARSGAARRPAA